MKRIVVLSFFLALGVISYSQTAEKKWGLGLGAGIYQNIDNSGLGFKPELYLSRFISPSFDIMLKQDLGLWNSKVTNDLDAGNTFLNLRYKLSNGKLFSETSKLKPYLYGGVGYLQDNGETGINFDAGIGTKLAISPSTSLFLEGGYIDGIEDKAPVVVKEDFWKLVFGIEFSFGKAKDTDGDGVSDRKDECPDTPAGVAVDEKGCPLDGDSDGVADYMDDCPTEAGLTSLKGCPDSDGDGIADKDDACPDVAGLAELKGCPDSDGDGVADKDDACADTPKGWKVDAKGCPLDQDKDGVADAEDKCPTEAGPADNDGCPVVEEAPAEPVLLNDVEADAVHFVTDKSYLTKYSKDLLDKLVALLQENPGYSIGIYGHADERASEEYNMKLSQERIDSVVNYLKSKGISDDQILKTKAYGETMPIASNDTAEGRQKNRRVEFDIFSK